MSNIDSLKVPAFMRKHQLKRKAKQKKLLLTALDRKKAGLANPRLKTTLPKIVKATLPQLKEMFAEPKIEYAPQPIMQLPKRVKPFVKEKRHKKLLQQKLREEKRRMHNAIKEKKNPVGVVTHYYDKISVGVIRTAKTIALGDELIFDTFAQLITSMQIDHKPVKKAPKGKEIGIKIDQPVKSGELVYKK